MEQAEVAAAVATAAGATPLKTAYVRASSVDAVFTGRAVDASRDAALLAAACIDQVKLVDLATGQVVQSVEGDTEPVCAISLSPDASCLAVASSSLQLHLWQLVPTDPKASGAAVLSALSEVSAPQLHCRRTWKPHDVPVTCIAWHASGGVLATGCTDAQVRVWDADAGFATHSFRCDTGLVNAVAFHPSRLVLVSAHSSGVVSVRDLSTQRELARLDGHVGAASDLVFADHAGRDVLITAGRDRVINVWDTASWRLLHTLAVYESVEAIAAVLDPGTQLAVATAGGKGQVRVWDITPGSVSCSTPATPLAVLGEAAADGVALTHLMQTTSATGAVGLIAASSDHNILIFDSVAETSCSKRLAGYNDQVLDLALVDAGASLAVATNTADVRLIDMRSHACDVLLAHTDIVLCLAAHAGSDRLVSGSKDCSVVVWDVAARRMLARGTGHAAAVGDVAWLSAGNGTRFVSGSRDTTLKWWQVDVRAGTMRVLVTQKAHDKDINSVAVSKNDRFIASASQDKTIKLWTAAGEQVDVLRGHRRGVWSVAFSNVDQVLASASADKTIRLWSMADRTCLKTLQGHTAGVLRVAFASAGLQLVSSGSDGTLRLWTIRSGECVATMDEHEDRVWAMTTSDADGSVVYSGAADSRIVAWRDATSEQALASVAEQQARVAQEQDLANALRDKDYVRSVRLALSLNHTQRLLAVFQEMLRAPAGSKEQEASSAALSHVLIQLDEAQIHQLLRHIADWNTRSSRAAVAHTVLHALTASCAPGKLLAHPELRSLLPGMILYAQRHFARLDRMLLKTALLDYTVARMAPTAAAIGQNEDEEHAEPSTPPRRRKRRRL